MSSKALLPSSNGTNTLGPPRLSSISSLARQGSIYSMTIDEFQNAMNDPGKNLGSMNMEDFLKNIWTAEESQAMAAALPSNLTDNSNNTAPPIAIARQASLQRHGSLSIPPDMTNKTVEEVWNDIHRAPDPNPESKIQQRQATLGEMTLEDFLAKAGVVRDENEAVPSVSNPILAYAPGTAPGGPGAKVLPPVMHDMQRAPQPVDWISFPAVLQQQQQQLLQQQHLLQQQQQQQQAESAVPYAGRLIAPPSNMLDASFNGASIQGPGLLSLSPATLAPDTPNRGKKRMLEGVEEKAVEQRQRRMIKNRESAARSRARKQAYTVELEAEVTQLKDENSRLKQVQDEETEKRRKQIMETFIPVTEQPGQARIIGRTRSTSW